MSGRVVDAALDSHSASTCRNFLAAWRCFHMWADREGRSPILALLLTVHRASPSGPPTACHTHRSACDRAAIRYRRTEAGHANPADNEGVRRVLRGLTRRAACEGRTPRQAAAPTEEELAAIRETAHLRRTAVALDLPGSQRTTSHGITLVAVGRA